MMEGWTVALDAHEVAERAKRLGELVRARKLCEHEQSERRKEDAAMLRAMDRDIEALADAVRTGREMRSAQMDLPRESGNS